MPIAPRRRSSTDASGSRRGLPVLVALATLAAASGVAAAPAAADQRRGVEADVGHLWGRAVVDPAASDGRAVRAAIRRRPAVWGVNLAPTGALRLRLGGCSGTVRVATDRSAPQVVRLTGGFRTVGIPVARGGPVTRIVVARGRRATGPCRRVTIDRVDVDAPPIPLGAAVRADAVTTRPAYRAAFARNFTSLTPENDLKLGAIQRLRGFYDFTSADADVRLARATGSRVRGHVLVYGEQLPTWLTKPSVPWTRTTLLEVMRDSITATVGRYRGTIDTWDVVNEAVDDDGAMAPNLWRQVIGPDYVELAFRYAHAADPSARLFYNEQGIEAGGAKQDGVARLLRGLRARGVPVDGIGLEAHVPPLGGPTEGDLDRTLARFADLGLRVEITEADAPILGGIATARSAATQATTYGALARACWEHAACDRMTTWGVDDGHSWKGATAHATLLDALFRRKPGYAATVRGLDGAN